MRRLWLLFVLTPSLAAAHPEHEVVQGAYLTLAPGVVRLQLELAPGPHVAPTVLRAIDANGDRRITDAEARAYAEQVLQQSVLTIDGTAAAWRLERIETPPYANVEKAGQVIKVHAVAIRPDGAGAHVLIYENRYRPAESRCTANVFLAPDTGWRRRIDTQQRGPDGRRLAVRFTSTRI